ncbi:RNA pseudouridine synthase, partial [candidate division KSB3 bacterium]
MIYAKTDKALSRLTKAFREGKIQKTYWALVCKRPPEIEAELVSWLKKTERNNTSRVVHAGTKGAKEARLGYKLLAVGKSFHLLEIA